MHLPIGALSNRFLKRSSDACNLALQLLVVASKCSTVRGSLLIVGSHGSTGRLQLRLVLLASNHYAPDGSRAIGIGPDTRTNVLPLHAYLPRA